MIAMNPDRQELSEVVVTGYSKINKRLFTGAVNTADTLSKPKPIIGIKAYKKYIKENLQLPTDDKCKDIKGKVIDNFQYRERWEASKYYHKTKSLRSSRCRSNPTDRKRTIMVR